MSSLRPGKKLQPAKRAWKSVSNKVQKLNIPKAIEANFKRLITTLNSLHHLIPSKGRRSLIITKSRAYAAASSTYHVHAICIEEKEDLDLDSGGGLNTIEDAWKALAVNSPQQHQLHVEDQKAEEFIAMFREDMRLQKERSLQEFQEMLARGC